MKKFVKNYIGKGKKVEGLEIIKVNLKISDIVKFAHKYNDEDYISLEVAKLQSSDNFGHDYTVYVNRLEEEQVSEPAPKARSKPKNPKLQSRKPPKCPSKRYFSLKRAGLRIGSFFYVLKTDRRFLL